MLPEPEPEPIPQPEPIEPFPPQEPEPFPEPEPIEPFPPQEPEPFPEPEPIEPFPAPEPELLTARSPVEARGRGARRRGARRRAEEPAAEVAELPDEEHADDEEHVELDAAEAAKLAAAEAEAHAAGEAAKPKKVKPQGPTPGEITKRIGATTDKALAYVLDPDPKLTRLSRKVREHLITELPPVTAAALLGPAALARHLIGSAATGRYRDIFALWALFSAAPEECRPILAERQRAISYARKKLETSVRLGLRGHAERVAEDVRIAQGLPWNWLREALISQPELVRWRPQIAAALLEREPGIELDLPDDPSERWLAEAARARDAGPVPPGIDALLGKHADRLPATLPTLQMAQEQYPERVPALLERVDLEAPNFLAILAWARDHGHTGQLRDRVQADVEAAAADNRAQGLARWRSWIDRGVKVTLPEAVKTHSLEGLDLGRPETADLVAQLVAEGVELAPQDVLDQTAQGNRMLGEKAYEAFICAGLDVHLPLVLEGNPMVPTGTRCPACQAWTWVRPGHESRCPRLTELAGSAVGA